jgi:hypothetical protein
MGGPFDDKDGGSSQDGKRPRPTIEGTATEVSVESETETAKPGGDTPDQSNVDTPAENEAASASVPHDGNSDTTAETGAEHEAEEEEDSDAPEPAAAATPADTTPRRSFGAFLLAAVMSFVTHVIAGLIGALAVLAAIAWGYLPMDAPDRSSELAPLEERLAKLEATPETPDNRPAIEGLESRLDALETKTPETDDVIALNERMTKLESSLRAMAEAAENDGSVADAAAVNQQINEAEKRLDEKIATAVAEARTDTSALDAIKAEIAAIDAKLKALADAELGAGDGAQLGPEVAALDQRLGKIESVLPQIVEELDEDATETKTATLAIAFANLRAAVEDGRPYEEELATLAALSPGSGDLGPLLDYEDTGIPTLPALKTAFGKARDTALTEEAPGEDTSLIDRLMASAESLVQVRRVDKDAEGTSAGAVLARAAGKLDNGDLEGAVKEVETLDGAPRDAYADWLDAAKARLAAGQTLQRLQSILLVSLSSNGTVATTPAEQDTPADQDDLKEQE